MKREFLTEVRVGLFVLLGMAVVMTVIFMLGSEGRLFERRYTLYTKFKDISGLRVGAPVQLAGLNVGMVDEINFSKSLEEKEIIIEMGVNRNFQDRIRADSVASINTQGLLGDKFVFVSVGTENQPVLEDAEFIHSEETTPIFALAEKAGKILDDIGAASKSIRGMLTSVEGDKGGDLKGILQSLRATLDRVKTGPGLAHALIYDPKGKQVISSLNNALNAFSDVAEGPEGKQAKGMIANLRQASADLKEILGGIRRGEGTIGKLIRDPEIYNDLRTLLGKADRSKLIKSVIRTTIEENDKQILK